MPLWLTPLRDDMSSSKYDIAIVGGGIIGLATALRLTHRHPRCKVAVVEKEPKLQWEDIGPEE